MKECLRFITTNCDSNAKPLLEKHMEEIHDKNLSTIDNNRDMTEIVSSCEDNKLKILESLHMKKCLLSEKYLLNTSPKKRLTVFQYTENELKTAEVFAINFIRTPKWGVGRSEEIKLVPNDSIDLTLLQAEFENFYDKTKRFITSDENDGYINTLRLEYNKIADLEIDYSSGWQRVSIADIVEENNENNILQHLAIELPISYIIDKFSLHSEFIEKINNCLTQSINTGFKSKDVESLLDTRTSIIYLMRCNKKGCKRDLYIGRTHVGKIRRHEEHTRTDGSSAVYQHINENNGHGFNIDDMEVLEVCCDGNKLKILEALYIKQYLLDEQILKGRDGILNKIRGNALTIFDYTYDERERTKKYLNHPTPSNAREAGGRQGTYELHHYDSENDSSEYEKKLKNSNKAENEKSKSELDPKGIIN